MFKIWTKNNKHTHTHIYYIFPYPHIKSTKKYNKDFSNWGNWIFTAGITHFIFKMIMNIRAKKIHKLVWYFNKHRRVYFERNIFVPRSTTNI